MKDLHILVADDHDFTRMMEKRALTDLGITRITEARDGEEALKLARANRPDVVISDLNMPGMDGMTFIGHLASEKLADSVIIASGLTKHVLKAVEAVAVASGLRVLGAIEKPLTKEAIASLLHAHSNPSADAPGSVLDREAAERAVALRQFKAWFAPILDVGAMQVVAVEASPRWEIPKGGVRTGADEVNGALHADAVAPVARAVIQSALATGGLWRQMGWKGGLALPIERVLLADDEFWTWLPSMVKKNGVTGSVSIVLNAELFAQEPARAAFALARSAMDGVTTTIRVRHGDDLAGLAQVASCNVLTCPVEWVDSQPVAMKYMRDLASRMGAAIGATGVSESAALTRLGSAGVRRAQGSAVGPAASSTDTYDSHLAVQ
jgi:CheY-like chemotaxis protein